MNVFRISKFDGRRVTVGCPSLVVFHVTDADGAYLLNVVKAKLRGLYANVINRYYNHQLEHVGRASFNWNKSAGIAPGSDRERDLNVYYHLTTARTRVQERIASHRLAQIGNLTRLNGLKAIVDETAPRLVGNAWWDDDNVCVRIGRNVSYALDSLVVYHEFAHGIINTITGDEHFPIASDVQLTSREKLASATGEALADYLACSLQDWPRILDGTPHPRDLDSVPVFKSSIEPNPYRDSLPLSSGLWELRKKLGKTLVDEWVFGLLFALRKDPPRIKTFTIQNAVSELIIIDRRLYSGRHGSVIETVFARRGLP